MPFDIPGVKPNSDEEILFKAVGFIVIQWGHAEQTLDMLVSLIFPIVKTNHKYGKQPVFLAEKTKFIRKHLDSHQSLKQFSHEILPLLARFEATGKTRNDLVHGAITSLCLSSGSFNFAKLDITKEDVPTLRAVSLDDAKWKDFRTELLSLGADGVHLVKNFLDSLKEQP